MPKKTADYRTGLLRRLTDPQEAAHYVEAAIEESNDLFLVALRDVAESRQMSVVAKEAGVAREALYRMLSETGNPTLYNMRAILKSVGLRLSIESIVPVSDPSVSNESSTLSEEFDREIQDQLSSKNAFSLTNGMFSANASATSCGFGSHNGRTVGGGMTVNPLSVSPVLAANNNNGIWPVTAPFEQELKTQSQ